jgi:MFS family permease
MSSNTEIQNQKRSLIFIPIMAIFALGASQGGVNAALSTMAVAFPNAGAGIAYVISIVALGMIPAGALSGFVTGRYVRYKTSIIIAIILYLISGCYPFFMDSSASWEMLLVTRFIFGCAVGWSYPQASALAFKSYHNEQKRARIIGSGMAFMNIGTLLMEFGGGYLALFSWQSAFLVYLIGIVPLLAVVFFLKEPERDIQQAEELAKATGSEVKTKITWIAWPYMIFLMLLVTFLMPTILYGSFVIEINGFGDSATTGLIMSAMTVVGALSGFTLGPAYKKLGKWLLPIAAAWVGIFYIIGGYFSQPGTANFVGYLVCFLVGHWGFAIIIPGTANILTNLVPIGAATKTMGFNTAFHQLGCFLPAPIATFMMGIIGGQTPLDLLIPCSVIVVILTVLYTVLVAFTDMKKLSIDTEVLDEVEGS